MSASANIARHLPLMAAQQPARVAIKIPRGRTAGGGIDYLPLTFAELDGEVDAWAARLVARGVRRGDRVLVMVRQGLPLIAAAFALFKLGAVPVLIDPGMGRKNFLACVARSQPRVLLGIPLAQAASHVFHGSFRSVETRLWVRGDPTARVRKKPSTPPPDFQPAAPDLAAILFTSGSTGAPKGVCYEHGMFDAQVGLVRETYGIAPGEIDLPMLPIFALFGPALGMTTIVPEIDPGRPAAVDPEKIVRAILQEHVTNSFGSPTLWRKIFDHCLARGITLPGLRRVLCAGAPVPASLWADAPRVLPNGQLHSPYGATEALPVATVAAGEMEFRPEWGGLIGRPLPQNRVKIIEPVDAPIASASAVRELPTGQVGEIIVSGPSVTHTYDHLPEATARAKIPDPAQRTTWHRLGDAGHLDAAGRLWFCGRLAERVETADGVLYTEPCEQVFRGHPQVARCALIGVGPRGRQAPALVVQPRMTSPALDAERLAGELYDRAKRYAHTVMIRRFYLHPDFPVDVRHNAKIHRLTLAAWAAGQRPCEFAASADPAAVRTGP